MHVRDCVTHNLRYAERHSVYRFGHVITHKRDMSTRAHIGFFEKEPTEEQRTKPEVLIYKHSDGYPEGTLPQLVDFCRTFNEHRGLRDTEYATARCVQFMTNFDDGEMAKWYREQGKENDITWSFLGYGVGTGFHSDVEFYYVVTPEEVKVYAVDFEYSGTYENQKTTVKLNLVQTVALKDEPTKGERLLNDQEVIKQQELQEV